MRPLLTLLAGSALALLFPNAPDNDSAEEPVEFLTIENSRLLGLLGLARRQSAGLATVKEARTQFGE